MTETPRSVPPGYPSSRSAILLVLMIGQLLIVSMTASTNVALSAIQQSLGANAVELQWLAVSFQLGYASLLITGGRLGDIFGHRRLFLIGVSGVVVASLVAMTAQAPAILIAARLAQGLLGAFVSPQVLAMVQIYFPADERPRAYGAFALVGSVAYLGGQILSGFLISVNLFHIGWRNAFDLQMLAGLVVIVAGLRLLPHARERHVRHGLDVPGMVMVSMLAIMILYPIVQASRSGLGMVGVAMLAAIVPMAATFVLHERRLGRRGGEPLINIALFRVPGFASGLCASIATNSISYAPFYAVTLTLLFGYHLSALDTSIATAAAPLGAMFGVRFGVRRAHRSFGFLFGIAATIMLVGIALTIATFVLMHDSANALLLVPAMLVVGFSTGVVGPTTTRLTLSAVPVGIAGSASSVLQTTQQLVSAIGVGIVGATFFAVSATPLSHLGGLCAALLVMTAIASCTGMAAALLGRAIARRSPLVKS